jgi:hypothetical protein
MPGTSMMSKLAFRKHEEALKEFGLVDDNDRPTWFTDGRPDPLKMLDIAGARAASIPLEKRAAYERALFGAQGGGGFALLADPAVRDQVLALRKERDSPDFRNRYGSFTENYSSQVTAQSARTAIQEFNNVMMDLGAHVLPTVNGMLRDFRGVLESVRGVSHAATGGDGKWGAGATAIEGGVIGAGVGAFVGGVGAFPGALIGTATGAAAAAVHDKMLGVLGLDQAGSYTSPGKTGRPAEPKEKVKVETPPVHFTLNVDGTALANAIIERLTVMGQYSVDSSAPNGSAQYAP